MFVLHVQRCYESQKKPFFFIYKSCERAHTGVQLIASACGRVRACFLSQEKRRVQNSDPSVWTAETGCGFLLQEDSDNSRCSSPGNMRLRLFWWLAVLACLMGKFYLHWTTISPPAKADLLPLHFPSSSGDNRGHKFFLPHWRFPTRWKRHSNFLQVAAAPHVRWWVQVWMS